jgi:hypothetical protein
MQTCSVAGCGGKYLARGLCKKHYYAKRRADVLSGVIVTAPCEVEGCERPILAKGLCASHYTARRDSARRAEVRQEQRPCVVCGADLAGRRPNAMYCSIRCKERAESERKSGNPEYQARAHKRYVRRADVHRRQYVQWAYRLTPEEYDVLVESQHGLCAICGSRPGARRLAIDHDHATGAIRGLLCGSCNNGLGRFKDNPATLDAAAAYLRR